MATQGHILALGLASILIKHSYLHYPFETTMCFVNYRSCFLQLEVKAFALHASIVSDLTLTVWDFSKLPSLLSYIKEWRQSLWETYLFRKFKPKNGICKNKSWEQQPRRKEALKHVLYRSMLFFCFICMFSWCLCFLSSSPLLPSVLNVGYCSNPNLGLMTKARACKGASQEWSLKVTFHAPRSVEKCEGMNAHTLKWALDGLLNF